MKIKLSKLIILGLAITPLALLAKGFGPSPAEIQQYVNVQNQQIAQRQADYAKQQTKYKQQRQKIDEEQVKLQKLYATPDSVLMKRVMAKQGMSENETVGTTASAQIQPKTTTESEKIPFCDDCNDQSNQYNYPANFKYNAQHQKVMRLFPKKCLCKPEATPSVTTIQNDTQQPEKKSSFWGINY